MELGNEASRDPRAITSHSSFTEHDFEDHHNLTLYVGVHVLSAKYRRHHHHHHHHHRYHKCKNDKFHSNNSDFTKPSTPPSERVRFIIGTDDDESHSPHPIFSEMEELFWTGNKMEWMETARWVKFEEDVEECGNRWSKPHIATVSLHSLLVLRSCLLNGTVLLDVDAQDIEEIADLIVEDMVAIEQLLPGDTDFVKRVLLCRHRHKGEQGSALFSDSKTLFHPVKSIADIGMSARGRSQNSCDSNTVTSAGSSEQPVTSDDKKPLTLSCSSSSGSKSFDCGSIELMQDVSMFPSGESESSKARRKSTGNFPDPAEQDKRGDYKWVNPSFMKKIPPDAQASNILVGELPFLDKTVTAFVRLEKACILGNLTEIPLPTKFLFVIFCPVSNIDGFHEVGRAFATVMSDEVFHDVAYKAKERTDLLSGIDEFMDAATVLPASAWDPATRIEPLPMMISQEARKHPDVRDAHDCDRSEDDNDSLNQSGLKRTGRIFGGLINDVLRKGPFYVSDFKDFVAIKSLTTVIFLYFACLAPIITFGAVLENSTKQRMAAMENLLSSLICGVVYGLFSGQPLTILGNTGALLVFDATIFSYCEWWNIEFLSFRLWIGLWTAAILIFLVAFDASVLVCYITRFTEEIFATLIAAIFVTKAFQNVTNIAKSYPMQSRPNLIGGPVRCHCFYTSSITLKQVVNFTYWPIDDCLQQNGTVVPGSCIYPQSYVPNVYMLSVILFAGTFGIGVLVRRLRHSPYLPTQVRYFMSDFAATVGVISMTILDACLGLDTPKLTVPDQFKPTWSGRDWVILFFGKNRWWTAVGASVPAVLATVLIFMDQQVTAVIVNRRENKLKKGCGYHLDLFIVAMLIIICSIFGLPWSVAATILSMAHVTSLEMVDETAAPGEKARFLGIREQRGTSICIFILIGLSIFFTPFLQLIPMPVLYGIFFYMGISSLKGMQFLNRVSIWFMPQKYQPDYMFLRQIPMKIVHCFTFMQFACFLVLFLLKYFAESALFFPLGLVLVIAIRHKVLVRFFTDNHLKILDDKMPEFANQRNEEYHSTDNLFQPHTASTICPLDSSKENREKDSCIANISESLMQSKLWKCIDQQVHKTPPMQRKLSRSSSTRLRHHNARDDVIPEESDVVSEAANTSSYSTRRYSDNPTVTIKLEKSADNATPV